MASDASSPHRTAGASLIWNRVIRGTAKQAGWFSPPAGHTSTCSGESGAEGKRSVLQGLCRPISPSQVVLTHTVGMSGLVLVDILGTLHPRYLFVVVNVYIRVGSLWPANG